MTTATSALFTIGAVVAAVLLGLLVLVYQQTIKRDPEVPVFSVQFYVGNIAISGTMIIAPWLVRRRLRSGVARERGNCESQPDTPV